MKKIHFVFMRLCCVIAFFLVGCVPQSEIDPTETQNFQKEVDATFQIDLTKISPMIQENVNEDVVVAAKKVIEAFLGYENSATIEVSGNNQRFLNDMAYVIHCTCPMFGAFTDFNEMSSYDASSGNISWNFFVEKPEFDSRLQAFYDVAESYLSNVNTTDNETMRTMLSVTIPEKYEVSDSRFQVLREKLPVEISELKVDKSLQIITFVGYEYECVFECKRFV